MPIPVNIVIPADMGSNIVNGSTVQNALASDANHWVATIDKDGVLIYPRMASAVDFGSPAAVDDDRVVSAGLLALAIQQAIAAVGDTHLAAVTYNVEQRLLKFVETSGNSWDIVIPISDGTVAGLVKLSKEIDWPTASLDDSTATTPAYVEKTIAAAVQQAIANIPAVPLATDTLAGKVSLAISANYPSVSDSEATTPAYVADAIAAIPNQHVPATFASANNSIVVAASGTDNQTIDLQTNAGVVPVADIGNNFAATNVEDALTELANAISPRWSIVDLRTETNQARLVDGVLLSAIMRHDIDNNIAFGYNALNVIPTNTDATTAVGYTAGGNLVGDGSLSSYFGYASGLASDGRNETYIGAYAGAYAIGNAGTFVGYQAGQNANGVYTTALGTLSGYGSNGNYNTFCGRDAGHSFNGSFSTGIGCFALSGTSGPLYHVTGIGHAAWQNANTLSQVTGVGYAVGQNMSNGNYITALGEYAMNWADNVNRGTVIGYSAGRAMTADDCVFIGHDTGSGWFGSGATLVGNNIISPLTAPVAVTLSLPNIINYIGHGVPIGKIRAYRLTATTYPGGMTAAPATVVVRALTADTMQMLTPANFTTVGVGVQLALYDGQYSNAGGFGQQAIPTANNQIRLGNAAITEVRTAGAYYGSAFNVVSDKRLKTDFAAINDEAAIEFSKLVNFTTFMRIKNVEEIQRDIARNLQKLRDELAIAKATLKDKRFSTETEAETLDIMHVPRSVDEIIVELSRVKEQYNEASKPENLLFGNRQVGVIAQEILELADMLGYGHFLVHEDRGYYTVDFNSLLAIVARGFQLRLEKAGI